MKKANKKSTGTIRKEYDFSKGIRGKYSKRYWHNNNIVVLSRDVIKYFGDSESVNDALRTLVKIAKSK